MEQRGTFFDACETSWNVRGTVGVDGLPYFLFGKTNLVRNIGFDFMCNRGQPISNSMTLAKQLRELMKVSGLTAAELSRRCGVPKASLSDWLAGSNPRDLRAVKRVADLFNVSVDRLVFGDLEVPKERVAPVEDLFADGAWVSGLFEVKLRRIKR